MKKLLFLLLASAVIFGVDDLNAFGWFGGRGRCCGRDRYQTSYECGPIPCCEKQEMVTVRKPADLICGYVCPPDTTEVGAEPAETVCCPKVSAKKRRPTCCP